MTRISNCMIATTYWCICNKSPMPCIHCWLTNSLVINQAFIIRKSQLLVLHFICLIPRPWWIFIYKNTECLKQHKISLRRSSRTVYPKKYAHGFVVLCFVVVMQSFIMNSHEVFIHIHQGCFAGTGAIVRLPQCQWSKPDGYGKISQCITTTKHNKAKTVCIFLGMYCILL